MLPQGFFKQLQLISLQETVSNGGRILLTNRKSSPPMQCAWAGFYFVLFFQLSKESCEPSKYLKVTV